MFWILTPKLLSQVFMMHAPLKTRSFSNLTFLDISLGFPEEHFVLFFEIRWKTEEGVTQILNGDVTNHFFSSTNGLSQCILSATYQSLLLSFLLLGLMLK